MQPGKTFQNLSPEKQERITRIASEEFSDKGFDGASVNAMVDRMGIAKGSIFQYFGDKKGLFRFVFNKSVEMVKDYLRIVRDQSINENLPVRLEKTLGAGIHFIKSHPLLYRLYIKVLSESRVPFREEILLSLRQHSIHYLKSLLEQAQARGEIRTGADLDKTAFILDAMMDRFLQSHTLIHLDGGLGIYKASSDTTDIWIKDMVGLICHGIGANDNKIIKSDNYILIISAVDEEIAELRARLKAPSPLLVGNRTAIIGKLGHHQVMLMATGPGMVNTAQALTAAIEARRPEMILQTGCAGAFLESGLQVGDVAVASLEVDIHSGLESADGSPFPEDLPFNLLKNGGAEYKNHYPINGNLVAAVFGTLQSTGGKNAFQVRKGPFVTVSTITTTDKRAKALFDRFVPLMEQMEGAAAAHIALLYDIPFVEIRSASNMVGNRDKTTWNLPLAFQNTCVAVEAVVRKMDFLKVLNS